MNKRTSIFLSSPRFSRALGLAARAHVEPSESIGYLLVALLGSIFDIQEVGIPRFRALRDQHRFFLSRRHGISRLIVDALRQTSARASARPNSAEDTKGSFSISSRRNC